MTATPESRLPLVLAHSVLSPSLAGHPKRRGDDDSSLPHDLLRPTSHHIRSLRSSGQATLRPEKGSTPQEYVDQINAQTTAPICELCCQHDIQPEGATSEPFKRPTPHGTST